MKVEQAADANLVRPHDRLDTIAHNWVVSEPLYVSYTGWLPQKCSGIQRPRPRSARQRRTRHPRTISCSRGDPDPEPAPRAGMETRR